MIELCNDVIGRKFTTGGRFGLQRPSARFPVRNRIVQHEDRAVCRWPRPVEWVFIARNLKTRGRSHASLDVPVNHIAPYRQRATVAAARQDDREPGCVLADFEVHIVVFGVLIDDDRMTGGGDQPRTRNSDDVGGPLIGDDIVPVDRNPVGLFGIPHGATGRLGQL